VNGKSVVDIEYNDLSEYLRVCSALPTVHFKFMRDAKLEEVDI